MNTVYDYQVKDNKGNDVDLKKYENEVLLIVNTATECGFTPTYEQLEGLYDKYHDQGFEILDFPCNQFGNQAPGTSEEIAKFCTSRFGVTFPQFAKCEVNGESALPLFKFLKNEQGFAGFDPKHELTPVLDDILRKQDKDYEKSSDIKWNFTKFLIDRKGNVVARFEPTTDIKVVEEAVKQLL